MVVFEADQVLRAVEMQDEPSVRQWLTSCHTLECWTDDNYSLEM